MNSLKVSKDHDLYNESLAPADYNKRLVGPMGLGFIWFGIAVQITVFAVFAPLVNYFTIGELIWIYLIGCTILGLLCFIAQDIGLRHGISFATSISASFGYKGGKIVAVLRVLPSVFFFAINGYVGATAINELFKIIFGFDSMFLSLAINITILVLVTLKGIKGLERFTIIISPLLLLTGFYMIYIVLSSYNVNFADTLSIGKLGETSKPWVFGAAMQIAGLTSVVLGMNDFTKDCKVNRNITRNKWFSSNKPYIIATLVTLVPFMTFFTIIGNITVALSGRLDVLVVISELIQQQSIVMAIVIQLFIFVAQLSTNAAANLLPSAYVVSSLAPKKISYKTATVGIAILACILQPWNYIDRIDLVLSVIAATAGPAIAIIGVDYYVFRKRNLDINDIFRSTGKYQYFKGFNIVAIAIYVVTTFIAVFFFFDYSIFISTGLAAVLYYIFAKVFGKKYPVMVKETAGAPVFESTHEAHENNEINPYPKAKS